MLVFGIVHSNIIKQEPILAIKYVLARITKEEQHSSVAKIATSEEQPMGNGFCSQDFSSKNYLQLLLEA